jgi:hypothetical protein
MHFLFDDVVFAHRTVVVPRVIIYETWFPTSKLAYSFRRQVRCLFQREFCTGCDLVLPLSISSILTFLLRLCSSCVRLILRLPVTSILPSIFPSITCFRRQFLGKV